MSDDRAKIYGPPHTERLSRIWPVTTGKTNGSQSPLHFPPAVPIILSNLLNNSGQLFPHYWILQFWAELDPRLSSNAVQFMIWTLCMQKHKHLVHGVFVVMPQLALTQQSTISRRVTVGQTQFSLWINHQMSDFRAHFSKACYSNSEYTRTQGILVCNMAAHCECTQPKGPTNVRAYPLVRGPNVHVYP